MPLRYFAKIDPSTGHVDSVVWSDYPKGFKTPAGLHDVTNEPNPHELGGKIFDGQRFTDAPAPPARRRAAPKKTKRARR